MLTDTHCHLNFKNYSSDEEQVIQRAKKIGLIRILNPGINVTTSEEAVLLAGRYAEVYGAVGVHPNEALSWNPESSEKLREIAQENKVVAIGEIGLDYYRDRAPRELQIDAFREQLNIAAEFNLPVVIHSRNSQANGSNAVKDVIQYLSGLVEDLPEEYSRLRRCPGVLHSFSGDMHDAEVAQNLNLLIGITGPITYNKADKVREVVRGTKIEQILIETDGPFLTPAPMRGKRNEPAYVKYIAEKIAEIKDMPYDFVVKQTMLNAQRIFNW